MTTQERWLQKASEFYSVHSSPQDMCVDNYLQGIKDFKASLREAIEKNYLNYADPTVRQVAESILQLLDTIEPINK